MGLVSHLNLPRCKSTCPNLACFSPPWSLSMCSISPGPQSQTLHRMNANLLASFQGLPKSENHQIAPILNQLYIHQYPYQYLLCCSPNTTLAPGISTTTVAPGTDDKAHPHFSTESIVGLIVWFLCVLYSSISTSGQVEFTQEKILSNLD